MNNRRYEELVSTLRDYNLTDKIFNILTVTQLRVLALAGKIKDASVLNRDDLMTNLLLLKDGKLEPFETSTKGAPRKAINNFDGIIEVVKNYAVDFNKTNNIDYPAKGKLINNGFKDRNSARTLEFLSDSVSVADFNSSDEQAKKDLDTDFIGKGVLEIMPDGYGFLRGESYFQSKFDVYVPDSTIKKIKLRRGDFVVGKTVINADSSDYLMYTHSINGL
ncbi:MAG: hypothetical protein RR327_01120, partial [Clostridia bacterium]